MVRATAAVLLSLLFAGCASSSKLQEEQLIELLQWLPGEYDNTAQAQADREHGLPPHEELAVVIVPVYAARIGDYVFYSQEMAADDPRRVFSQRLISFDVVKGKGIVQSLWSLTEPRRWRDAHLNPDLFKSLQPQDIELMRGCELVWTKTQDRFTAENERGTCMTTRPGTGPGYLELRAELTAEELALSDRLYDSRGTLIYGRSDEPFYRFKRRSAQ